MIELRNVSAGYEKGKEILHDLSINIDNGESVGIIGANGAGKSTLMKCILGLIAAEGDIYVNGSGMCEKNLPKIRKDIGFVLQNSDNQMFMPTVLDDMLFGPLNYGLSREEAEKRADEVLTDLGIEALKYRHNHKLSGGEKRMAAIATVLCMDPDIIVMDEPTSALDPYNRRKIINLIKELEGTKIIVSHDLDMILDTCSRVILLSDGRITADGKAEEILHDRDLLEQNRLELPLRFQ